MIHGVVIFTVEGYTVAALRPVTQHQLHINGWYDR